MPRKAPNEVIEHRISLSNFERDLLVKEIAKAREAGLYRAGINQIGGIAGSGVLLYGLIAYFGYNILSDLTDNVKSFVDKSSTGLADFFGDMLGLDFATNEANAIYNANDRIDEAIKYEREQSRLNEIAFNAFFTQFRNGEITLQEFDAGKGQFVERTQELEQLTQDIAFARNQVKAVQAKIVTPVPAWLELKDWRALLIASYTNAYNPSGGDVFANRTYSEQGTDFWDY
tara:strand:- start:199 stop:888 length:690 start_codon:yes stop_codon:yes gene_type:complete